MKKETVLSTLLKAGIIGLGTLGGFAVSKLFSVVSTDDSGTETDEYEAAIEVPFEEVPASGESSDQ